jgi:hypothetical protein
MDNTVPDTTTDKRNEKGKGKTSRTKGRGTDKSRGKGQRNKDPCSYCNKPGHEARECRKRMYDEKQKAPHTNNSTDIVPLQVDETTMMFTNNAIHIEDSDEEEQNDVNGNNEDYETWSENWYTKDEEPGVWQEDDDTLIFDESITSDDQVMVTTELESLSLANREPTNNDDKHTQVSLTVSHTDGGRTFVSRTQAPYNHGNPPCTAGSGLSTRTHHPVSRREQEPLPSHSESIGDQTRWATR